MNEGECCGKCKFSMPDPENDGDVFCRRFPPVPIKGNGEDLHFHWPKTKAAKGWCGEFKPAVVQ